jgi:hypothetical protein
LAPRPQACGPPWEHGQSTSDYILIKPFPDSGIDSWPVWLERLRDVWQYDSKYIATVEVRPGASVPHKVDESREAGKSVYMTPIVIKGMCQA